MLNRNDVWVLEFSDNSDDICLRPEIVGKIGNCLEQFAKTFVSAYDSEGHIVVDVVLTAADRGSLRLAFLARIRERKDDIAITANILKISAMLGGGLYWALTALGAVPVDTAQNEPMAHEAEAQQLAARTELRGQIAPLIAIVTGAGVDSVSLYIPGCPTLALVGEHSKDVALIGSRRVVPVPQGGFTGDLKNIRGPIHLTSNVLPPVELYWGTLDFRGEEIIVLIDWKATKTGIAMVAQDGHAYVQGSLGGFKFNDYFSNDPIPAELKAAAGTITVERRLIEG